ncbi:MFS general substrate transporter [Parathielavia hyrcaniae]|uniref:MFS general substrate transporter n=1 Tax=Parathielavia hyrcaniae TaxID=113614 RepID=A0AAN6T003_9PEZI|nr:MFS general substrate transporter [Parathielavia hyrcaniae]
MAMFRDIASDFDSLGSASWVITAYSLGLISAQPLYGKLSDIYGRKPLLLIAYACYCVGGLLAGVGFSFWGLLLGRFICGIGNAGITVLISTLIVDLVPIREVAVWRGYVYAINQIGRAVGPSIGGLLADRADWRWALLFQVPLNFLALLYIWRDMSFPPPPMPKSCGDPNAEDCRLSKLRRVDFSGSTTLALANVSLLLFLDRLQSSPGSFGRDLSSVIPMSTWLLFLVVFLLVEALWAREPIIPLRLLTERNVMSLYGIQLYTSAPLYFRVTVNDSTTRVAMRLLVISLGTVIGGLVSGFAIKHTGRYRLVTIISILLSNISFLAVFFRWRGPTGWAETLYGFPIGLGFGVSLSSAFIGLTATLEPAKVAVGTSGFYLSLNLGALFGVSASSTLITTFVERALRKALSGLPDAEEIIRNVMSKLDCIDDLPADLAHVVRRAYTRSFVNVWVFSLVFGCLALVASLIMREGNLDEKKSCRRRRSRSHPGSTYYTFGSSESREA